MILNSKGTTTILSIFSVWLQEIWHLTIPVFINIVQLIYANVTKRENPNICPWFGQFWLWQTNCQWSWCRSYLVLRDVMFRRLTLSYLNCFCKPVLAIYPQLPLSFLGDILVRKPRWSHMQWSPIKIRPEHNCVLRLVNGRPTKARSKLSSSTVILANKPG